MDAYRLDRFVAAQDPIFDRVREELARGRKQSHWMWFVFPQIAGLGRSEMARAYALGSLDEAHAYLSHEVLGPRLLECTRLVNRIDGRSVDEIFGSPDNMKFHSSMTLFARVPGAGPDFSAALAEYFAGIEDEATVERLA
ncbi:hypothetical protein Sa4125_46020 [Aureimonas sp. SA4125]|nr:DUF1810 domain-containing protein [Aureimonas sp. SA4125]BDA87060.1 hypothetical protein Sa4125_46020 [Aureimonas sp. SA4125]